MIHGCWEGNGMDDSTAQQVDDAIFVLGLMQSEITGIVKVARFEADVAREMAEALERDGATTSAARWKEMAAWWRRRVVKWKEIEARIETRLALATQLKEETN